MISFLQQFVTILSFLMIIIIIINSFPLANLFNVVNVVLFVFKVCDNFIFFHDVGDIGGVTTLSFVNYNDAKGFVLWFKGKLQKHDFFLIYF